MTLHEIKNILLEYNVNEFTLNYNNMGGISFKLMGFNCFVPSEYMCCERSIRHAIEIKIRNAIMIQRDYHLKMAECYSNILRNP